MRASDLPTTVTAAPAPPARADQLYAVLSATNEAILRADSAADLYQRVCDAATGSGLITQAAVLMPTPAAGDLLHVVAGSGVSTLGNQRISIDQRRPEGRGLAGTAYQSRQACVSPDVLADPRTAPWRDAAAAAGVRSGAAVPLVRQGTAVAVMLFYSPLAGAFDDATVHLLERLAENVCFALAGFERETERARMAEALQRFRAAIDMSGDSVYLTDFETMRFVDVNQTACRRLGYTREQLLTMGPADLTTKSPQEVKALFEHVIACAPDAVVSEQQGTSRDRTRTWASESSRRAMRVGNRWLVVTISRDIGERRRQQALQALQHAVTRRLAQIGTLRAALEAVLAELGTRLQLDDARCVIAGATAGASAHDAAATSAAAHQAAAWQRGDPGPTTAGWADTNALGSGETDAANRTEANASGRDPLADQVWAIARTLAADTVDRRDHQSQVRLVVPVLADDRTIGALALFGGQAAAPEGIEPVLVAVGEQLGQYIRRKQAEQVLAHSEARFRSLTELSSDWYWQCDTEHRFVTFGGRSVRDLGRRDWRNEFFGRAMWDVPHLVHDSADWASHRAILRRRERFLDFQFAVRTDDDSLRWTSASGEPLFDADGVFIGYHGVSCDITARRQAEDSIRYLATHDALTGLPNRALFIEELGRSLRAARRDGRQLALLFADLDHFKVVNDTLGHDAGDLLLARMAMALRDCLRPHDLVARLGGDEFVVLVRHPGGREDATAVARKVLAAFSKPMLLKGQECRLSASVGISIFPDHAADEAALMKGADIAMYEAKHEGRNAFRFFSTDAQAQSPLRLRMASNLRTAIEHNEFTLHYQPKIDLHNNRIVGAEALLRWNNPELGAVPPAQFIALAEESGLMSPIGRWVLVQACAQHIAWCREGLPPVPLALNLSPRQFADPDLVADIECALRDTGMPARALELEITEGVVIGNPERASATLQAIRQMGVRLAFDDFGTGYASLAQLKQLPIDALKIDRSFVAGLPGDRHDRAITEAIIVMGRTLQLTVVAEGVETDRQREFLRDRGCAQMQGYQFSRPLPPAEFAALLRRHLAAVVPG